MKRLRTAYLIAANTALLMLVLELASHLVIVSYRAIQPHSGYDAMSEPARQTYAPLTPGDINELWRDTVGARWRYEPIVGYVSEQLQSRFINISAEGIRSNGGEPAALDGSIWFFGGSTTFGYGVADRDTVPAYLQANTGRPVINFGVPGHYSFNENQLLNGYLRLGFRPSAVLFLDGVNERCETGLAEDELGEIVAASQRGYTWQPARPVIYLARNGPVRLLRAAGITKRAEPTVETRCEIAGRSQSLAHAEARLLAERDMLCTLYQLDCRTYIQPFAGLHGRHDAQDPATGRWLKELFTYLEPVWRQTPGVTFVTHALDRSDRHGYVDEVHYSAGSHALIADAIAANLQVATATPVAAPRR